MSEELSHATLGERDKKYRRRPLLILGGLVLLLFGALAYVILFHE